MIGKPRPLLCYFSSFSFLLILCWIRPNFSNILLQLLFPPKLFFIMPKNMLIFLHRDSSADCQNSPKLSATLQIIIPHPIPIFPPCNTKITSAPAPQSLLKLYHPVYWIHYAVMKFPLPLQSFELWLLFLPHRADFTRYVPRQFFLSLLSQLLQLGLVILQLFLIELTVLFKLGVLFFEEEDLLVAGRELR